MTIHECVQQAVMRFTVYDSIDDRAAKILSALLEGGYNVAKAKEIRPAPSTPPFVREGCRCGAERIGSPRHATWCPA
jgi:hypothetical protein